MKFVSGTSSTTAWHAHRAEQHTARGKTRVGVVRSERLTALGVALCLPLELRFAYLWSPKDQLEEDNADRPHVVRLRPPCRVRRLLFERNIVFARSIRLHPKRNENETRQRGQRKDPAGANWKRDVGKDKARDPEEEMALAMHTGATTAYEQRPKQEVVPLP